MHKTNRNYNKFLLQICTLGFKFKIYVLYFFISNFIERSFMVNCNLKIHYFCSFIFQIHDYMFLKEIKTNILIVHPNA